MSFPFEKLDVYQKSVHWLQEIELICRALDKKVSYALINQLYRASLSISLNIAEGNGRWHKADKRQYFWIARGSVFECVPLVEILRANGLIDESRHQELYKRLEDLGKMLSGLIKSVESLGAA